MARLNKEQLKDRSRYQFREQEAELPELGGSVLVKTLSVKERNALPDLVDENGKSVATVEDLAKVFASVVADPKFTPEEAAEFVGDLPAGAFDRVSEKFGELLGGEEDKADAAREFRDSKD